MKVTLINPNFSGFVDTPTLGLVFIGTFLKQNNRCEIQLIEPIIQRHSREETLMMVEGSDFVCLTCYTESRFECLDFCSEIKERYPKIIVILGGPHVNTLDLQILQKHPFVDIIVRGEGEIAISEIINGKSLKEIPGVSWRSGSENIRNPFCKRASDIDIFKFDYELIPFVIHTWKDNEVPYAIKNLNAIPIITSRGCPFNCSFCAANRIWENTYRKVSQEEVIIRIKELIDRYNIRYFRFFDALFIGNENEIFKFCDLVMSLSCCKISSLSIQRDHLAVKR